MAWVHSQGRRLYCFEHGEGRPVVLLHGMALAGIAWAPQLAPLVRAGFRVLVPDMVGHGASDAPRDPIGIPDLVDDLLAVLDAHRVADADLVGVSMGGTTALAMAGMNPERVRRLVVLNAGPSTDLPALKQMLTGMAAKACEENGPLDLVAELWPISVNERFAESDEGLRTRQQWDAVSAAVQGLGLAHVMEGVAGFDGAELLSRIEAKTLFVAGSEDPSAIHVRKLPNQVSRAAYAEIVGAKHIANVDEADAFTAELLRFLA